MARIVDPNQPMDPENAAVLSGAPRSRGEVRENSLRGTRTARKNKDKFFVPKEIIPNGWCVEWKRKSVLGKAEEADYYMDLADAGWKYADPKIFKTLVPEGYTGGTIERGGMVLMTRPMKLKKEAQKLGHEEALGQVRDKLSEIGMTGQGELPRKLSTISREYDRPAARMIPDDSDESSEE